MVYSCDTPFVTELNYQNGTTQPYDKMSIEMEERHKPRFGGLEAGMIVTPVLMTELFLPNNLLQDIIGHTNSYARARLPPSKVKDVTLEELLRFLAIYYYMGLVVLPSKSDYWRRHKLNIWPTHPVTHGISSKRFQYIWRNIHLTVPENAQETDDDAGSGDDDDEEEEEEGNEDPNGNQQTGEDDQLVDEQEALTWYDKAKPLLDHVNKISQRHCINPGFCVSLDEQMKLFKGRNKQTVRMKAKPIKEGFKFFAICDASTGYVYSFVPSGRLEGNKIADMVLQLAEKLPDRDNKKYVIAMDNYFTLPDAMLRLRQINVACVGTARGRRGWPPKEIKDVKDDRFNTVYHINDRRNFRIFRWIDNNTVIVVSTLHDGTESIVRRRRRPRVTVLNKAHVDTVFGNSAVKQIGIPGFIDDYNHWMGGVDKSDQYIAYYRPKLRVRRYWMAMMNHGLDIVRINAYIIYKKLSNHPKVEHKEFITEFIEALVGRADQEVFGRTRQGRARTPSPKGIVKNKARMSTTNPQLPRCRFRGSLDEHTVTFEQGKKGLKQLQCVYCAYLKAVEKQNGGDPNTIKVAVPSRKCSYCNVHLCKAHFDVFHDRTEV
ncbi:unnamed protein product [Cylindrotheca closterium]|uniref:PiggyBac transposable element-derived protein domain-containing protein n=1 Tax=Cylindrotheca closterium TaxID=2856 RepID=A0AAD2CLQ9_9STRA|nr:unnamed protein product [Cylindrotheca closterium]